ncbi:MAG: amidohydrolase family protein [Pseudomonadota bacterium]
MAQATVFTNARLIDVVERRVRNGVSILVEGERIARVVDGRLLVPGAEEIDLAGRTVLPGLIDTHVHTVMMDAECFPLFLAAGVTAARDVGGRLDLVLQNRAELNSGARLGPRLFVCGPLLDGPGASFENPGFTIMLDRVESVAAVPAKIGGLLAAGVDGIKCYFTMTADIVREVIRFVGKRVPVTGHLGYCASMDAIEAGIDGLEHMWISPYNDLCALNLRFGRDASMMKREFWTRTLAGWEEMDLSGPRARAWFSAMVDKQVHMGTTLDLLWTAKAGVEASLQDPDRHWIPPAGLARQAKMKKFLGDRPDWDIHPGFYEVGEGSRALERQQEAVRILHESGGRVVGGTDCGALAYPPPGFALLREIELLAEVIGTMAALRAVTHTAAEYLRAERDIGAVAPGRYADFLVLSGDPIRDVRELRSLELVYRGGVAHRPAELLARVPRHRPDGLPH